MKYIIWGLGNTWANCEKYANLSEILCFTDSNESLWGRDAWGKRIISPKEALSVDYDRVVVMSELYYNEIFDQLVNTYNVKPSNIMNWLSYVINSCSSDGRNQASFIDILKMVSGYSGDVLDYTNACMRYGFFSKGIDDDYSLDNVNIDGMSEGQETIYPIYANTYRKMISKKQISERKKYYATIVADYFWNSSVTEISEKVIELLEVSNKILFNIDKVNAELTEELRKNCNVRYNQFLHSAIYEIEKKRDHEDIGIYVVTHKPCKMPLDDIFIPIHVGSADFIIPNMVRDDAGDNIANYNSTLNECTAMYWMWKHSDCSIIGLNHYRRFFERSNYINEINIIDEQTIRNLLDTNDVILAPKYYTVFRTVGEHLADDTGSREGIIKAREIISSKQPDYLDAFDYVFDGYTLYRCNLFVTRKEIFDKYCEWLFSFIIDINDAIDVSNCNSYSKRMAGFIAERMLTVWLIKQNYKIKELPFIQKELG